MNLIIKDIKKDDNNSKDEYAVLYAQHDVNIGDYIITDTTYNESGKISNKEPHMFAMPNKWINKGDYVYIHTGKGKDDYEKNNGKTIYHIYRNLEINIWNSTGDLAILYRVKEEDRKKFLSIEGEQYTKLFDLLPEWLKKINNART